MEMETTNWLQHAVFTNSMPELTKALYNIAIDVMSILTEALNSFSQAEAMFSRPKKEEDHVRLYVCIELLLVMFLSNILYMFDIIGSDVIFYTHICSFYYVFATRFVKRGLIHA